MKDRFGRSAKMEQFLLKHNMHPSYTNMAEVLTKFRHHMSMGLAGNKKSSLLMLPTYVRIPHHLPQHRKVLVLDAGGTNLRKAVISFDEKGDPIIENFAKAPMPGSDGQEISKQAFYDQIASIIDEEVKEHRYVGFCFSYPARSTPEGDGKVLVFSKEIVAPEVIGSYVGHSLKEASFARNPESELSRVMVVNDTVTTLLSGLLRSKQKHYSSYMGFILGTGMNMAYVVPNFKIAKLDNLNLEESQVVNLEAGGFSVLYRGDMDRILDQQTSTPGNFFMEKMMSGAYFGRLCAITMEFACEAGVFEPDVANLLRPVLDDLDTKAISEFYNNIHDEENILGYIFSQVALSQREVAGQLIANLLQRVAKVVAATLSAMILESGEGLLQSSPICITIDGTTFYAFHGLEDEIRRLMKEEILIGAYQRYFEFTKVESASLVGAAIATYVF
ncbi:hypothetical protein [Entomospira culicis]|uniref:Hexokinase n=1 Tax=Entomospira culicis TaxID=2719989 RepID=A0A968GH03_9SPIO|nr:hypothetical protein [Entomospira culicis]NIZ19968.1 hypothetical protein [Entomospira culicis]NIZ70167.1 hypothetical protein [Entomospira culicis]WDI38000.1 hypothetical protein PVA46_08100 [Entomospira culicis]WDI39623.1 hypothetical protein PVA47_08100 [Entomospira culicis]